MKDQNLVERLTKFGYSNRWLDYGVLTLEQLSKQEAQFDKGEDKHTEHYRYRTFGDYLSSKKQLTDPEFDNYVELTFADPDKMMAGSATADLFYKANLTDDQFQKLCQAIGHFGPWTEKVIARQTELRKQKKLTP